MENRKKIVKTEQLKFDFDKIEHIEKKVIFSKKEKSNDCKIISIDESSFIKRNIRDKELINYVLNNTRSF